MFDLGELPGHESCNRKRLADVECIAFEYNEVMLLDKFLGLAEVNVNISFPDVDLIIVLFVISQQLKLNLLVIDGLPLLSFQFLGQLLGLFLSVLFFRLT